MVIVTRINNWEWLEGLHPKLQGREDKSQEPVSHAHSNKDLLVSLKIQRRKTSASGLFIYLLSSYILGLDLGEHGRLLPALGKPLPIATGGPPGSSRWNQPGKSCPLNGVPRRLSELSRSTPKSGSYQKEVTYIMAQ